MGLLRILTLVVCFTGLFFLPAPARAQTDLGWDAPAIGEAFHVELMGGLWNPTPTIFASSEEFGIPATNIDFGRDLGLVRKRTGEMRLVLRPGRKHKFRIQYVPLQYQQQAVLERQIVFRGIAYNIGIPVSSTLRWDTWRLGYEYDVVAQDRWFLGLILEAKYTQMEAALDSAFANEYARARGPIPAIGGIGRVYVTPYTPITVEVTGFKWPQSLDDSFKAEYIDLDVYGTFNVTNNFGVQVGYRSIDLNYLADRDTGNLQLEGMYFAGLVRF